VDKWLSALRHKYAHGSYVRVDARRGRAGLVPLRLRCDLEISPDRPDQPDMIEHSPILAPLRDRFPRLVGEPLKPDNKPVRGKGAHVYLVCKYPEVASEKFERP